MNEKELIAWLAESAGEIPSHAEVFGVRQYSIEEMTRRARRVLGATGEMCAVSFDRGDWVQQADRTLVRLPFGGRAVMHHASGAMKVVTGLAPMEHLFEKVEPQESLIRFVEVAAERLPIAELVGSRESVRFERLWQIKASATDRERKVVEPVLCRVVGAYRQVVGNLPVWGAAAAAIKLAAGGALDSIAIQVRETSGEPIDWAPVVHPEVAASQIVQQLGGLMGRAKVPFIESVRPRAMHFGYLGLSKRITQRVLAPHYVAFIEIEGEEAQAYQLVVQATEKTYLPLCQAGKQPPPAQLRRMPP
jgi:hypothetical protein